VKRLFLSIFCLLFALSLPPLAISAQEGMGGVGIVLDKDPKSPDDVLIYSVTYRSVADKARIKRGDRLLKVDGVEVKGKPMQEIADKIRGPLGSSVVLTIETQGGQVADFPLVRENLARGPVLSIPPPTAGNSGVFFTEQEKTLIKQKILTLQTEEQRQKMLQLLQALKSKQITKQQFLSMLNTEF